MSARRVMAGLAGVLVCAHGAMGEGLTSATDVPEGGIRFLVSEFMEEPIYKDSYVVVLEDPAQVAQAREILASPGKPYPMLLWCHVFAGADGINRDFLAPGAPAWSWHVELVEFTPTTVELIDGVPSYVESDVEGWIENTEGQLGFWMYTVTAELGPVACVSDFDASGAVDAGDLNMLLGDFGCAGTACVADTNGDLRVDAADLNEVLSRFGTDCGG